jgi:predicted nucleotidyltransferase
MTKGIHIEIPKERIEEFCKRHYIRKLSLFGSALRDDFTPESDLDILVEFDTAHIPGLIRLAGMEIELTSILGRKVDMWI